MNKLCKMQFCFIFSKTIIFITLFLFLSTTILCLFLSKAMNDYSYAQGEEVYLKVVFNIIRLLFTIITIVISSYSFISTNDQYSLLMRNKHNSKTKIWFSKFLVIFSFLLLSLIIEVLIIGLIGYIKYHFVANIIYKYFVELLILILYYLLLSMIFILLFDYFYISIIPIGIFLLMEMVEENFLKYFFIKYQDGFFSLQGYYYLFLSSILFISSMFLYNKKNRI